MSLLASFFLSIHSLYKSRVHRLQIQVRFPLAVNVSCLNEHHQDPAGAFESAMAPHDPQSEPAHIPSSGPLTARVTADELRSLYVDFLHRLSFVNSPAACSPDERKEIAAAVTALCGSYMTSSCIAASSGFPAQVYKFHPFDFKVKTAHFTALAICIDDLASNLTGGARDVFVEDLALFQMKMCHPQGYAMLYPGRGDLHQVLEEFMVYLRTEQSPFFPVSLRMHSVLVKSSLDFLEGNLLDQHYEEHPMAYLPEMRLFSNFLRDKTGLSEAFAIFLLVDTSQSSMMASQFFYNSVYPLVPELIQSFNFLNDVFSFYKEMEDGETQNCILIHAKVKKMSALEALKEICTRTVKLRNRMIAIAQESGSLELKKRILQFWQGYASWHLGSRRYRLKELLGDWYQGECW